MPPPYVLGWLKAFLVTTAIELPIASWLFQRTEPRTGRRIALILFANLASHPLVWFFFPALGLSFAPTLGLSEAWAVASEAVFYRLVFERSDARQALGVSALANSASLGLGLLLRAVTRGWV